MTDSLENQIAAMAEASLRTVPHSRPATEPIALHSSQRSTPWLAAAVSLVVLLGLIAVLATREIGGDNTAPVGAPPSTLPLPEAPDGWMPQDLRGVLAPALWGTTSDGSVVNLASMRGSWVVVDVFATWCVPCLAHPQALIALVEERPDVRVLTLAFDDDLAETSSTLVEQGALWPVVAADETSEAAFHLNTVPTTFVIDPDGVVAEVITGGTTADALVDAVG